MFEVIFVTLLVTIALGGIWAFVVTKKVKKEGFETDAVVSRVEIHEWGGTIESKWGSRNYTEDYYISYTDHDGNTEEALLSNPGGHKFKEGDKIRIKILPDRPEYPVLVEIL